MGDRTSEGLVLARKWQKQGEFMREVKLHALKGHVSLVFYPGCFVTFLARYCAWPSAVSTPQPLLLAPWEIALSAPLDLLGIVNAMQASGLTPVRSIAGALNDQGSAIRGSTRHPTAVSRPLKRLCGSSPFVTNKARRPLLRPSRRKLLLNGSAPRLH